MLTEPKSKSYHSPILGIFTCEPGGNLTSDGIWTHTWDYQNRLASSTDGIDTITYTYDHSGQRASLANNTTTTYYPSKNYNIDSTGKETKHIMAGGALVATVQHSVLNTGTGTDPSCEPPQTGDWTITDSCTFTGTAIAPASVIVNAGELLTLTPTSKLLVDFKNHKLLVKHTGGVLIKQGATLRQVQTSDSEPTLTTMYIHTDHLGGTNVTTDESGAVSELVDYYPYGGQRISTGSHTSQKKYIGEYYDPETNLNYLNARYYKSPNGQFISQDPVFLDPKSQGKEIFTIFLSDPQTQNSYTYARNNPITLSDPDGKFVYLATLVATLAMYTPQINSFAQSLMTPLGQVGISQAIDDADKGNYGMALFGAVTAGEVPSGRAANNLAIFGKKVGSRVNNVLMDTAQSGLDLKDHAAYRIIQRNISTEQVMQTVKNNNPIEYFHEGQWKNGFRDVTSKIFVGQEKNSGRITTVINNTSNNYLSNLVKEGQKVLSKLKK
jgi:RHS repeat-associated protein